MKKVLFGCLILMSFLFAKTDFSEMSTEELIALIGYVDQKTEEHFYQELDKRVTTMSEEEKALYDEDKKRRDNAQN
ncbi:DUF1104 domain-containing protein [Sulfurospirillum diekertiae]|jgi:hypothetical protein|uniref:DUF1104 domain-containing protein n=1 Tax=Sulfurospirillum diekertiae TaxID=1854492 RepID=A0A6G9VUT6_9BACT|nr:DUF1104 domain-containing protein [Sulfurospirillum diekertiae]QIR76125.1 DUF1104 domain-containing protein [Sulfurospirillum diekertiae]QIR78764.1 DUF1104 domain-containing protein [Sulfurospirillum diekertiae]